MASWRPAESLVVLKDQLDQTYPGWLFLGMLGDAAHAAVASDHNPNAQGVVTAMDIGPGGGLDIYALADRIRTHRHPDLKYVISNRKIAGDWTGWAWASYNGADPHDTHTHVSVGRGDDGQSTPPYDDTVAWDITEGDAEPMFNDGDRKNWLAEAHIQDVGQYANLVGKVTFKEALEKMRNDNLFRMNKGDVINGFAIFGRKPSDLDQTLWTGQQFKKFMYDKLAPGVAAMPPKGFKPFTPPSLFVED